MCQRMARSGLFYVRLMDDILVLAPTRWRLWKAVKAVLGSLCPGSTKLAILVGLLKLAVPACCGKPLEQFLFSKQVSVVGIQQRLFGAQYSLQGVRVIRIRHTLGHPHYRPPLFLTHSLWTDHESPNNAGPGIGALNRVPIAHLTSRRAGDPF